MKKYISVLLVFVVFITSTIPAVFLITSAKTNNDIGNISLEGLKFAHALRATEKQVSVEYDDATDGFEVVMPSNSKHVFMVSKSSVTEETYTASFEYMISSTDTNATVGLILGAEENDGAIDLKSAYKVLVHKHKDLLRLSSCDGDTPEAVGTSVSFDSGNLNVGVTYKANEWNKLSVTVTKEGKLSVSVNGVEVYSTSKIGYVSGYVGLYAYLPKTQFRNFNLIYGNVSKDDTVIDASKLKYAYGLRATEEQVSLAYDENEKSYEIKMPSNSKHIFLVSDKKTDGEGYTVSMEYQIASTDANADIALLLGAKRDIEADTVDITSAYKLLVFKNTDRLRFASCDGATPDAVGNSVKFDSGNKNNIGVTYISDDWNKLSVSVSKEGKITVKVNGVEVYTTSATGYIDGYIGLYTYLPGTKFRNFEIKTLENSDEEDNKTSNFKYAYGLRATEKQVSLAYDENENSYEIKMPSNSKHIFLVSDKKTDGEGYTVSMEYQIASTDANADIALLLGAKRDIEADTVDITSAYKLLVFKNTDRLRFASCDGATPDAVGNGLKFDSGNKNNIGVTYISDGWNKLSVSVSKEGKIIVKVNGVKVYTTSSIGYIDGYVGLYTYLPGTKFRNFEISSFETENIPDSEGINLANLSLAYALRATADDVDVEYNKLDKSYKYVVGGDNSKHYFLMSNTQTDKNKSYRVSFEYQMDLQDKNATVGLVFGAEKDSKNIYNLKTAYKAIVYGNYDQVRVASCDGNTPVDAIRFDSGNIKNIGAVYAYNQWNKIDVEIHPNLIEIYINNEKVFQTSSIVNANGYIGLYSYLTDSSFRKFNIEEIATKKPIKAGFFYDLTMRGTFSFLDVRNAATNAFYDDKEKNVFVSPVVGAESNGSKEYATIYLGSNSKNFALPNENCSCEEFPIIAMKVKLNNKNTESGNWRIRTSASEAAWQSDSKNARWVSVGHPSYIRDDDWQIVYIDTSKINNEYLKNGAVYDMLHLPLIYGNGTISTEKDLFRIEWIGAFTKVEDIKEIDSKIQITGEYSANGMDIDKSLPGRLFYDFSKPSDVSRVSIDRPGTPEASTAISYDSLNKAMKVSVLPDGTNNGYARIYLGGNTAALPQLDVSCDEYPVIALKIKLKNTNLKASGGWLAKTDGEDKSWADLKSARFKQTDEWQVVYNDTRYIAADQRAKMTGNHYTTISIRLLNNNRYDAKANYMNDEFLVAWAGVFKTVKDAREYGGEVVEETKAKFLYDFTQKGSESFAENLGDTITEYDADVGAMKVSIKPGTIEHPSTRFYLGKNIQFIEQGVRCEEYPVIAMRVKLNNPESKAGYWHYTSDKTDGYGVLVDDISSHYQPSYQKTTEWQTVLVNSSDMKALDTLSGDATWKSLSFRMLDVNGDFSVEKDVFWVAWIAGFASEKDAYEFSGVVTDSHEYVAVVGDELTYGVKASSENRYPINLQTNLGEDFSVKSFYSFGATVQNNTQSSFRETEAFRKSLEWNPGILVMMLGTNDSNLSNWKDAARYKKDLVSLIKSYQELESKPQIYLCTTPYIIDEIAPGSLSNKRIKEIVKVQKEVAKELGLTIIDIYDFLEKKTEYYFNGVYLNDVGYPAIAKFIAERIKETYKPKSKDYVFRLDSAQAIKEFIEWSELDDTEIRFDDNTSTMLVKAVDAKSGEKADGVLNSNVAGFKFKVSNVSSKKYPVVAIKLKLGRKTAKAGWYGFDTNSTLDVKSAQRPIYEMTTDWQTVIIDYSNPESNTMISDFSGNWEAVSFNLGVDNMSNIGDTYNVEWIGLFSSVDEAKNYGKPVVQNNAQKGDSDNKNIKNIIFVISICILVVLLISVSIFVFIKKRRV